MPGVVLPLLEWVVKNMDQAVAWYLTKHVMYGYRFLIQNYRAEDRICMFVVAGTLQAFPKAHIQRVLWLRLEEYGKESNIQLHLIKQPLPTSVVSAAALKKLVLIMQRQHYVALGGPHAGLYDSLPPLDYDRILPIAIKAGPDIADLLADLVELFPKHTRPDQMARIIEHSDKVGEVSNKIKSKIYCVLDGKMAFGNVRMMFITDNFKEVESFLNNGNTWKRETSLHKGLLYMLQDIQGAELTPPKPSAISYRRKPSISPALDSCRPAPTPSSSSTTTGPMPTQSSSKGKGRERSQTPDSDSEVDLELEERVSRLEERFDSLGL
ncbi:hypothetical protein IW261DRAFT_1424882 [Armillaria novae-zelandiae]|uniref:T6SS Phospholipase effector Tle1-like catalytic domain-containing protein n=1 Tax=Armillaria novae-zelandiae TaxID=153914 RepID=A0AA39NTX3_9AGAR|nr:hypothetical protein IW261DRAFT_1424882 [Armillaria novae-zelandiae]